MITDTEKNAINFIEELGFNAYKWEDQVRDIPLPLRNYILMRVNLRPSDNDVTEFLTKAGFPDLLVYNDFNPTFFEVKTSNGGLNRKQRRFFKKYYNTFPIYLLNQKQDGGFFVRDYIQGKSYENIRNVISDTSNLGSLEEGDA